MVQQVKKSTISSHIDPPYGEDIKKNFAFGIIGGVFVTIVAFTAPFIIIPLRSPLPYMATPKYKVEKALRFILQRVQQQQQQNSSEKLKSPINSHDTTISKCFLDLGSGDGTAVFTAASLGFQATGLELNPTLWLLSSLRCLFLPHNVRSYCTLLWKDMFSSSHNSADIHNNACWKRGSDSSGRNRQCHVVMIFGVPSLMPKIASLIQSQCFPGSYILSYRFRVPFFQMPFEEKQERIQDVVTGRKMKSSVIPPSFSHKIPALLIYEEEEMRIYELVSAV